MKLILLTIIGIFFAGGVINSAPQDGERLSICEGQQKVSDAGKMTIKFVSVMEDSRCPVGVNCVWAGNAKVQVTISKGESPEKTYELNSTLKPQSITAFGYEIKLADLSPKPGEKGKEASKTAVATFSLSPIK